MAMTLVESAKLTNDYLVAGVIATIVKDNPIMERLPFIDIVGSALTYNRENALPTAAFYDVGDTWAEDTPTYSQVTAALKILGGDADVDQFIQQTRSNINDQEATAIELKAKAVRHTFENRFFYGDTSAFTKEFDGLHSVNLIPLTQQVHMGTTTTGAPLDLIKLDQAIDLVKPGRPDLMVMTRAVRRRITQHSRASGYHFTVSRDEMGRQIEMYGEVPMVISDFLLQTETVSGTPSVYTLPTTGATSTLFLMQFGEGLGICGAQNGPITVVRLGELETKDASRTRIKWYVSLLNYGTLSASLVDGITDAAVTDV
jgi:hypothetical protein